MDSLYAEASVKRKKGAAGFMIKSAFIGLLLLLITLMVVAFYLFRQETVFLTMLPLIGLVVLAMYFVFPRFSMEYEYVFCDGQLDFDRIIGNAKRKTIVRIDFENVVVVAPIKSHELDQYRSLPVKDYSSADRSRDIYGLVGEAKKGKTLFLFEPSEKMLECMKMKAHSKVKRD